MMKPDPEIEAVRAARKEISRVCGHDPKRLVEFYQRFTVALKETGRYRFIGPGQTSKRKTALAAK
jgi:hypothetical protein